MTPIGLLIIVGGGYAMIAGLHGLWVHRAELPDLRRHPEELVLDDIRPAVDAAEPAAPQRDEVVEVFAGAIIDATADVSLGYEGLKGLSRSVKRSGALVFFGAIAIVTVILYELGA